MTMVEPLTFRAATQADLPFLLELRRKTMSEHLQKLLDEAVQAKATVILSVLKSNPARRLYERLGFRIVDENEHAYDMQFGASR